MTRLREAQRLEQCFWNTIGIDTKIEDVQRIVSTVENNPWLRKLVNVLGNLKGKKVIDCGCRVGNLSVYLAMKNAHVKGFDISSEMVKVACANAKKNGTNGKCNFLCCSFEDLPYRDISFDLAVGSYILHHVDVERAVRELHRVLKPGESRFHRNLGQESSLGMGRKIFSRQV